MQLGSLKKLILSLNAGLADQRIIADHYPDQ